MSTCKQCKAQFEVGEQEKKLATACGVPLIPQCHTCRRKARMQWRNEIVLYNNTCSLCHKDIVAVYPKDSVFPVYCEDCWWSDIWSAEDYGMDFKQDVPFFKQFHELLKAVPRPGLTVSNNTNCAYVNYTNYSNGSYFTFGCKEANGCLYSWRTEHCNDCVDSSQLTNSEYCFESIDCEKCYRVHFSRNAINCNESFFLLNCVSCSDCFGCVNLTRKSCCIFNKQYSKEEYAQKIKQYDLSSFKELQKIKREFHSFSLKFSRKYGNNNNCEVCTGDTLSHCKDVNNCFSIVKGWNCFDVYSGEDIKDALSCDIAGWPGELVYNNISGCVNAYDVKCCSTCWSCARAEYCDNCHHSEDIFGCVGLKKNQYCILNKTYTKEEYEKLRQTIVESLKEAGEYGFFFPAWASPHAYNESIAQDYYPLTKEDARINGFQWRDNLPGTKGKETIAQEDMPDCIDAVEDSITNEVLACIECNRNYKIIKQELTFYRKENFALPRMCPQCRIRGRLHMKNSLELYHRQCMCSLSGHDHTGQCTREFETTYSPERPEKVFCEQCYQKEVV
ncbi:MAG TPA: hypothetical protein DDW36_01530 [Candidatus Magasanikbacteria bacterium]|nr:hypothetical protein [Candidatus Magasanikbacteria bacterium]